MFSSMTCAWSGAFVVFGGVAVNTWILIRAFSMHLQICWDIIPGRLFFWFAQLFGWLLAFVLLSTELSLSGVSFRFGDYCHVNHAHSLATLWGPLLGFAGLSLLLQLSTFTYCLNVYLRQALGNYKTDTQSSRQQTSLTSTKSANARVVFRRVKKVVSLQWRGLAIAVLVVTDVIFFSIVFVVLDKETQRAIKHPQAFTPWLTCMVLKQDKEACISLAEGILVNESILIATLLLLAVVGIEAFILICRLEMLTGWAELVTSRWQRQNEQREFVSLDARRFSADPRTHELLNMDSHVVSQSEPSKIAQTSTTQAISPITDIETPISPSKFDERLYRSPHGSFSSPRPPSAKSPPTSSGNPPLSPGFGHGLRPFPEEEKI
ncbi:MAG: hypothetical protein M1831_000448 [Alyxoria varia]|nr:MAG: hypothetical protein M1831_000448 [Alyxoria varia]